MKSKKHYLKRMIAFMTFFTLASAYIPGLNVKKMMASTVLSEGVFRLNATNMDEEHYVGLEWFPNMPDNLPQGKYNYTIYQSADLGTTWESRSSNYNRKIKVLNIYPQNGNIKGDQLKGWMENSTKDSNGITYPPAGFINGQQLISVDGVSFGTFNGNADMYLKDGNGNYKYDVIMFGSGDSNFTNGDLSNASYSAVESYIKAGYGVLAGHDIISRPNASDTKTVLKSGYCPNLTQLAINYFGISPIQKPTSQLNVIANGTGTTGTIQSVNDGFLLQYPWQIPYKAILTVPLTHTTMQYAGGTVWMNFNNPQKFSTYQPVVDIFTDGATNNFYLTTFNNTAIIQTGHVILPTGVPQYPSTNDERQILANTLMYLAQVTAQTTAEDRSARDTTAPTLPTVHQNVAPTERNLAISTSDNGTPYQYYIKATNMDNNSNYLSDKVETYVKTNLKGYYIWEDSNTYAAEVPKDSTTGTIAISLTSATDGQEINYTTQNKDTYIHIAAVDNVGNISTVRTVAPFYMNLSSTPGKIYKDNRADLKATVQMGIGTSVTSAEYVMVPVHSTTEIQTEAEFRQVFNDTQDASHKGTMARNGNTNQYNLNDARDNTLNGVSDNCTVWVLVKGIDASTGDPVTALEHYTFTNLYTMVDVYQNERLTSDGALFAETGKVRVGIGGDTMAKYGVPLDLDGTLIQNPAEGYDELHIVPKNLQPWWTPESGTMEEVLRLDSTSYVDTAYLKTFDYQKNSSGWYAVTFDFKDESGMEIEPGYTETQQYGMPTGNIENFPYMTGLQLYAPPQFPDYPAFEGYDPVGYVINQSSFAPSQIQSVGFPLSYGTIQIPEGATVTIVYKQDQVKITEQYHLFAGTTDSGALPHMLDNINAVTSGDAFTGTVLTLPGYVLRGYEIIDAAGNKEDLTFDYPTSTSIVAPTIPDAMQNYTIVYKYKVDSTGNGIADEDQARITVTGLGTDAFGNYVQPYLYKKVYIAIIGQPYTPTPLGTQKPNGAISYDNAVDGTHWILDPVTSELGSFTVAGDHAIILNYNKDSSGNGVPDIEEANVEIYFQEVGTGKNLADSTYVTALTPTNIYKTEGISIPKYKLVGAILTNGTAESKIPVVNNQVFVETPTLGEQVWKIQFLYQPIQPTISIVTNYVYLDGRTETEKIVLNGVEGEVKTIDAAQYNKYPNAFSYTSGMASAVTQWIFKQDIPQTVTLNYHENENESESGGNKRRSMDDDFYQNAFSSDTNVSEPTAPPTPIPTITPEVTQPENNIIPEKPTVPENSPNNPGTEQPPVMENTMVDNETHQPTEQEAKRVETATEGTYLPFVDTTYALVGKKYLAEIPDDKVPEGYQKVQKVDEEGVAYWTLEEEDNPFGVTQPLTQSTKENPKTGDAPIWESYRILLYSSLLLIYCVSWCMINKYQSKN